MASYNPFFLCLFLFFLATSGSYGESVPPGAPQTYKAPATPVKSYPPTPTPTPAQPPKSYKPSPVAPPVVKPPSPPVSTSPPVAPYPPKAPVTPPVAPYPPKAPVTPPVAPYPPKAPVTPPVTPPAPAPYYGPGPPVKKEECGPLCEKRCSLHSRQGLCLRACSTCCLRCKCVPPGTYGNKELCGRCYTDMTTHGGRLKCP